jgi:hypothetical protein
MKITAAFLTSRMEQKNTHNSRGYSDALNWSLHGKVLSFTSDSAKLALRPSRFNVLTLKSVRVIMIGLSLIVPKGLVMSRFAP